jgi:hypothetical protein
MADEFNPEILTQDITRQRELAKMLLQQGMQNNLQGQMVSGRYVGASPWEGIAKVYSAYKGGQLAREADTKQAELANMLRQQTVQDLQSYGQAVKGVPEQTVYGAGEEGPTMNVTPAVAPDYEKGLGILMGSKSPQSQALAQALLADQLKSHVLPEGGTLVRGGFGGGTGQTIQGTPKEPTEYKEFLKAQEGGFQGSFFDYQQALKKAGATNVNVSTEKSYGSAFGQGLAKNDLDLYDQATKAPEALETVKTTKKLLDSGKVYTGFGANAKLDLARVGDAFGVAGKDTSEKITNTQQLFANRAQATLDSVKASGLGAGNGFTNADREFLEKAKLGGITYDKTALQRQLDIEEKVARASANKWNTRLKSIPKSATEPTGINQVVLPMDGEIDTSGGSGRGWRIK